MMPHDSNDTLFPWYGNPIFEISARQKIPILAEMHKKFPKWISNGTPMMSHDSNDTLFPWHGHTSFEISMRQEIPILAEMRENFPNEYPMELLWCPTIPTTPCSHVWTYPLRDLDETGKSHFSLNAENNPQLNIKWNSYDVPQFQRHNVPLVWAYQLRDLGETTQSNFSWNP